MSTVYPDARETTNPTISPSDKVRLNIVLYGKVKDANGARTTVARELFSGIERTTGSALPDGYEFGIDGRPIRAMNANEFASRACELAAGFNLLGGGDATVSARDASVLLLDKGVEKSIYGIGSGHGDTTGEINPDGTLNRGAILKAGSEKGLADAGQFLGSAARAVGEGAGTLSKGFFSGLGTVGTLILIGVGVLALVLFFAYIARGV